MKFDSPHQLAGHLGIHYSGDVSIEYGGVFYDTSNWYNYGYADAVRITDLDSACGFVGGVLIEKITVNRHDDLSEALASCGWEGEVTEHQEIDACLNYGYYDPCDDYSGPYSTVITTDPDSRAFDGWQAEAYIPCEHLLGYIAAKHLGDFR